MTIVLNGTTGITNDGGYTGDGVVFADTTPANTLVTTTGGNVGVGTSSPTNLAGYRSVTISSTTGGWLEVTNGTVRGALQNGSGDVTLETRSAHPLIFGINGAEKARIDSSGNLLVGTTSNPFDGSSRTVSLASATNANAVAGINPNGTTTTVFASQSVTTASTGWYHFIGQSGNGSGITTNNVFIYGNGNILNTNNSYGAMSDAKLKENVVDATPKLEKLCQVRVVNYNLIDGYEKHKQLGVIAQELEQVFPGMVEETPDRDAEGNDLGTTTKSVKYSVFVPMLIKAIQEQQAIITALTARVAALEGTTNV